MYVAVYGDFSQKDVRIKLFPSDGMEQFRFQNVLREAGYDCDLFVITYEELRKLNEEAEAKVST